MQRPWLQHYPQNVPAEVRTDIYPSIATLIEEGFARYADREAAVCLGSSLRFSQMDEMSEALAAWLHQHQAVAVVLRPDRYIAGLARDAAELETVCAHLPGAAIALQ